MDGLKEFNKDLIGKKAYKKSGYFRDVIGIVRENKFKITNYMLVLDSVNGMAHVNEEDIEIVTGEEPKKRGR